MFLWELPFDSVTKDLECTEECAVFLWELREPGSQSACCCSDVAVKGQVGMGWDDDDDDDDAGVGLVDAAGMILVAAALLA